MQHGGSCLEERPTSYKVRIDVQIIRQSDCYIDYMVSLINSSCILFTLPLVGIHIRGIGRCPVCICIVQNLRTPIYNLE